MRHIVGIAVLGLALVATPALAQGAEGARFAATTLDLSGHGEVRAAPDMATIQLGVTRQAPSGAAAVQADAKAMTAVVAALRAGGIEARDIRTSTLSLTPQYAYAEGQPRRLTGYEADNQVTVTVDDLSRLGVVVDAVVNAGANNVGDIRFGLKSRAAAETAARVAAVKALEDKAAELAGAAGYRVGRLVNLSEGGAQAVSPARAPVVMMAFTKSAETPVEAGDIIVSVDVTGEFELSR